MAHSRALVLLFNLFLRRLLFFFFFFFFIIFIFTCFPFILCLLIRSCKVLPLLLFLFSLLKSRTGVKITSSFLFIRVLHLQKRVCKSADLTLKEHQNHTHTHLSTSMTFPSFVPNAYIGTHTHTYIKHSHSYIYTYTQTHMQYGISTLSIDPSHLSPFLTSSDANTLKFGRRSLLFTAATPTKGRTYQSLSKCS